MKVVIVLCVKEFHDELEKIFSELNVLAYSETDVRGFKQESNQLEDVPNWFGSEMNYYNSVVSFSFVTKEQAESVLNRVADFNRSLDCCSPMHAFMLNVEKTV
ncbi:MAG: hypothetical protein ACEPOZ_15460 [Marinifilaceae bacterium]